MAPVPLMVSVLPVKFHVRLVPQVPLAAKRVPVPVRTARRKINSFCFISVSLNSCRAQLFIVNICFS